MLHSLLNFAPRTLIALIVGCFIALPAFSQNDRVSIIVGQSIITQNEVNARILLLKDLYGVSDLDASQAKMATNIAKQSLIDEMLLVSTLKTRNVNVHDEEVQNFISRIEKSRNLGAGFFRSKYKNNPAIYRSFFEKIRGEAAKSKLVYDIANSVDINESEVTDLALRYGKKDVLLNLQKFTIQDKGKSGRDVLKKIQSTSKTCKPRNINSKVNHEVIDKPLSTMTTKEQIAVRDIRIGDFSAIIEEQDYLSMYQLCYKKLIDISSDELDNISNIVENRMLSLKFMKYIETIRKKSYIKIF